MDKGSSGFTLLEMLIAVAIMGVLTALALPYAGSFIETQRLKTGVETIVGDLHYARTESIKRNLAVAVTFTTNGSSSWSYVATPALWNTKTNTMAPGIQLTSVTFAGQMVTFNPVRGTANSGQLVMATSDGSIQLRIGVGPLGQVTTCTQTANPIGGYPAC
ncbi:MAG: GspH/FimT family pseudopilin [Magnetococcales bacterium]|nr:GspH/FimT family pseudopilin [Magnetococcales bacterium]